MAVGPFPLGESQFFGFNGAFGLWLQMPMINIFSLAVIKYYEQRVYAGSQFRGVRVHDGSTDGKAEASGSGS